MWSCVVLFLSCRVLSCSCRVFVCVTCFSSYRGKLCERGTSRLRLGLGLSRAPQFRHRGRRFYSHLQFTFPFTFFSFLFYFSFTVFYFFVHRVTGANASSYDSPVRARAKPSSPVLSPGASPCIHTHIYIYIYVFIYIYTYLHVPFRCTGVTGASPYDSPVRVRAKPSSPVSSPAASPFIHTIYIYR